MSSDAKPQLTRFIHQVNIADGFADDCDELLHLCSKHEVLTYEAFCNIWKEMSLANIYKDRTSGAEIAELSEEVLHIAKHYMVANTSNFEESVAGVFLVYALINLQPFPSFAWLRVVPDDVPAILRIESVARRDRRLDVLFILGSILINHSQYHAVAREHGLEISLRKYLEDSRTIDRQGIRPKGVFYRQNEELDMIRELKNISKMYANAKANITEGKFLDRNLNYTDTELPAKLDSSMKKVMNGLYEDDDGGDDSGQGSSKPDHHTLVQSIKHRAMQSTVLGMKHLTGIKERSPKKSPTKTVENKTKGKTKKLQLPIEESDNALDSFKVKTYPGKQKPAAKGRRGKRRRKFSSSSEEEDTELDLKDDDDGNDLSLENIDEMDTEIVKKTEKDLKIQTPPEDNPIEANVLTNLNFESLPIYVQTGDKSQLIEIEIIDERSNNENTFITDDLSETGEPVATTSKEVNIDSGPSTSRPNDDDLFKKPDATTNVVLKKKDKSLLKKPILKSKFKKLGILPIANFSEDDSE